MDVKIPEWRAGWPVPLTHLTNPLLWRYTEVQYFCKTYKLNSEVEVVVDYVQLWPLGEVVNEHWYYVALPLSVTGNGPQRVNALQERKITIITLSHCAVSCCWRYEASCQLIMGWLERAQHLQAVSLSKSFSCVNDTKTAVHYKVSIFGFYGFMSRLIMLPKAVEAGGLFLLRGGLCLWEVLNCWFIYSCN